jgi:UDP-N-acetylglucosamine--N-acetylmuramyl-(pentapeptide) pyrophosphoryl-undecaprenol N-acetylglucosamine transferase
MAVDSTAAVLFVGTAKGLESRLVPEAGLPLATITARGYQRRLSQAGPVIKDFFGGLAQAVRIVRQFKPDVVLGTGGYVSAPVVAAAVLMRRPVAIHEQNALPGMANRYLALLVNRVCLSFEASQKGFPRFSRTVFTGNPRASEAAAASREEGCRELGLNPALKTMLVLGGSRGALKVNQVIVNWLKNSRLPKGAQLVYATGESYYRQVMEELGRPPRHVHVRAFINQPAALAAADLVISRSGATTLAEITALGVPAILVPSPNVVNDHQYHNARLLADAGAAVLIVEQEFNPIRLERELDRLLADGRAREKMSRAGLKLAVADAAANVYRCLLEIAERDRAG